MLKIGHLSITIKDKVILTDINLNIKPGEMHILMGPNGSGKTTLALALMGHSSCVIARSESSSDAAIYLDNKNITNYSPNKRARAGLFLSMQNPVEINGVTVRQLLRQARLEGSHPSIDFTDFINRLRKYADQIGFSAELLDRDLNVGFSGGEKKKLELLQMLALKPKYAILDEIDTGLDVDSLKIVAKILKSLSSSQGSSSKLGLLIITHNPRLFEYLTPSFIHVIKSGKIVETGGKELIHKLEKEGYAGFN